MQIYLTRFPIALVEGAYTVKGDTSAMPDRMRMLETGACADSFARDLAPHVVVSDMYRTAESSLAAMQRKGGVQPPSFSHHNYGRAIDLSTGETLKRMKAQGVMVAERDAAGELTGDQVPVRDKRTLDLWLADRGWYCFRGDHKSGRSAKHPYDESWHYDFLGDIADQYRPRFPYVTERRIAWAVCQARYASAWTDVLRDLALGPKAPNVADRLAYTAAAQHCQRMLKDRGFYSGAIDGKIGPISVAAIGALQRAWCLWQDKERRTVSGKLDARTVQVLSYVSATLVVTDMVEGPPPPRLLVDDEGNIAGLHYVN